jgi:hypothetical protein
MHSEAATDASMAHVLAGGAPIQCALVRMAAVYRCRHGLHR